MAGACLQGISPCEKPTSPASRLLPFEPRVWPRTFVFLALVAFAIQLAGAGPVRDALIYDRAAIADGEFWRLWTGHLCHFGWTHVIADTGLFLIIGWTLERRFPLATRLALVASPAFVAATLYFFSPDLSRYAGLSGVNVGLLVFLSLDGWYRRRGDWFWPAILLVHAIELALEAASGGAGGGAIRFDEPAIRIATAAHVAGALYGFGWFLLLRSARPARSAALAEPQLNRSSSQAI
jgi:rhomboid family GlyGly-CTERM serine protease